MRGLITLVFAAALTVPAWSAEGMWTLDKPPLQAMQKELGWAPDAAWLGKAMRASARIAGGCSASFVSGRGLVLTNHHCVAGCAEDLSTAQTDYLKSGFLAHSTAQELRCPAMEINRLEAISDVTDDIHRATAGLQGNAYKHAQDAAKARLTSACVGSEGAKLRCDVVDLYHGGQYKLYRYHRFQDVRLVFAPEQAIAFFGGDPDNFNFPRYDLDMALLRVYEDGQPAGVQDHFRLNPQGASAGEAVMVTGHPGSTERELTVAQLLRLRDQQALDDLVGLAEYRGVVEQYRTQGAEQARTATATLFYVENSFKAVRGELAALLDTQLFDRKQAEEQALRQKVLAHPDLAASVGPAWGRIAQAVQVQRDLHPRWSLLEGGRAFRGDYFRFARTLVRGAIERSKDNAERLPEFNDSKLPELEAVLLSPAPIYPEFQKLKLSFSLSKFREALGADDPLVKRVLGLESPEQLANRMVDGTRLGDLEVRKALWQGGADAIANSTDPFIRLALALDPDARALRQRYEREVEAVIRQNTELIAKARFALSGDGLYPDATFTLRLSYGVVKGWDEAGQAVLPLTQIGGAFERATGVDPFALPDSWLNAKDKLRLSTPMNLVSTNDIIGGNSGSPMLNRQGELVGLVFDGNIHSLGGAYWFDESKNRTVAVTSQAIVEALTKVYNASSLVQELLASSK